MYAVLFTGGKQYKVEKGDILKVEKLELDEGSAVDFDKILMVADGDNVKIGAPYLDGAIVTGEVVAQERDKKIKIIKFKRRKHQMKQMGHRQYLTKIKITDIKTV